VNSVTSKDAMIMTMTEMNATEVAELQNSHEFVMIPALNGIIQMVYTPATEH
jgi:hypothetical protein